VADGKGFNRKLKPEDLPDQLNSIQLSGEKQEMDLPRSATDRISSFLFLFPEAVTKNFQLF